jgi:AraC family transcriptional activator of pyochelin receptor
VVLDAAVTPVFCSFSNSNARTGLHCPYQGMMRRVYLEAKTLELIALQFSQLVETEQPRYKYVNLKRDECDRIYQARDILINNLHNPPSLIALAQEVSLYCRFQLLDFW